DLDVDRRRFPTLSGDDWESKPQYARNAENEERVGCANPTSPERERRVEQERGAIMSDTCRWRWATALFAAALGLVSLAGLRAADDDLIPRRLPKEQRENLQRFLQDHAQPDRYVPK